MVDESQLMELLQLAGRLIMENGGEIYRVEETVVRMGRAIGLQAVECFAVPSGIMISYRTENGLSDSTVVRVRKGGTNLYRVNAVNAISRKLVAGGVTATDALEQLRKIQSERPPYGLLSQIAGAGLCAGAFAVMFGGGYGEFIIAAAAAVLARLSDCVIEKSESRPMVSCLICAFLTALFSSMVVWIFPAMKVDIIVAGALMPLLPGLAMTNAVADLIRGDMLSGVSHAFSALLTAGMIALGTILSSGLIAVLRGGGIL